MHPIFILENVFVVFLPAFGTFLFSFKMISYSTCIKPAIRALKISRFTLQKRKPVGVKNCLQCKEE